MYKHTSQSKGETQFIYTCLIKAEVAAGGILVCWLHLARNWVSNRCVDLGNLAFSPGATLNQCLIKVDATLFKTLSEYDNADNIP